MQIAIGTEFKDQEGRTFSVHRIEIIVGSRVTRKPIVNIEFIDADNFRSRASLKELDKEFRQGSIELAGQKS